MKDLSNILLEKLHLNKDIKVQNIDNNKEYSIEYISTAITKVAFLLQLIMKKTNMKGKVEAKHTKSYGLRNWFKIKVNNKEDFLWLICWIYNRVSNESSNIKDDFDKKMKSTIDNYKLYKEYIHLLYSDEEIYNAYIKFLKYNNI